jgi:hypothetical protein
MMISIGLESARAYLEAASANERALWARDLQAQLDATAHETAA